MRLEYYCNHCQQGYHLDSGSRTTQALDRLSEEGPWKALGDGATFEDRLASVLDRAAPERCPKCGREVRLSESEVCQFSLALLGQW